MTEISTKHVYIHVPMYAPVTRDLESQKPDKDMPESVMATDMHNRLRNVKNWIRITTICDGYKYGCDT